MSKVTYLIGAGASCGCLPLVTNIPGRLIEFRNYILDTTIANISKEDAKIRNEMAAECNDLIEKSSKHASIDTYAKKLFITEPENNPRKYNILKTILSLSFIYDQLRRPPDQRYDTFFASILRKDPREITDSIRIISWNYDFQFERAYSEYSLDDTLDGNQKKLRVFADNTNSDMHAADKFSIFKINGTAAFHGHNQLEKLKLFESISNINMMSLCANFLNLYKKTVHEFTEYKCMLTFAWENPDENKNELLIAARTNISKSDTLVVIGYSFPFFNRNIDKLILQQFTHARIYIQDTQPDRVLRSLKSILFVANEVELIKINSETAIPEPFYLPPEL